jgi:hypothetical protein
VIIVKQKFSNQANNRHLPKITNDFLMIINHIMKNDLERMAERKKTLK